MNGLNKSVDILEMWFYFGIVRKKMYLFTALLYLSIFLYDETLLCQFTKLKPWNLITGFISLWVLNEFWIIVTYKSTYVTKELILLFYVYQFCLRWNSTCTCPVISLIQSCAFYINSVVWYRALSPEMLYVYIRELNK